MAAIAKASDPVIEWITPEQQLLELTRLVPEMPKMVIVGETTDLPTVLLDIVKRYLLVDLLPTRLTDWHTGPGLMGIYPERVPRLPPEFYQQYTSPCPARVCSTMKPNGAPYTKGEKFVLTLVAREFGTIRQTEASVTVCWEKDHPLDKNDKNPLRLDIWSGHRDEMDKAYGNTPPPPTYWRWAPENVLENSTSLIAPEHLILVSELGMKMDDFRGAYVAMSITKIATDKKLYEGLFIRLGDKFRGYHMCIGFSYQGVDVNDYHDGSSSLIAVAGQGNLLGH